MTQFLEEILQQPQALTDTATYYYTADGADAITALTRRLRTARRIVATGMGSSYFLAQALASMLAERGIAVVALNAGELLHYNIGVIDSDTLLIAISQSGESYETVKVLQQLRLRGVTPLVASITNCPDSTLAHASDIVLPTVAGNEDKTSTKTFITAYQVMCMIASALDGIDIPDTVWEETAKSVAEILATRNQLLPAMLDTLGNATYIQYIARGPLMASASQSALMTMEASHTAASALYGGEFRHGPLEMVGDGFTAVVLAHSASSTFSQIAKLVNDILDFGGRVLLVSDSADAMAQRERLTVVTAPCATPELFAIPAIIPVQLAIEAWAREAKGITPGEFTHGNKVTAVE